MISSTACVLKLLEGGDEVAVVMPPRLARLAEFVVIHPREIAERAVPVRAMDFLFRQVNQAVEMPRVTLAQQRVAAASRKAWARAKREARFQLVALPAVEHLDQRQVGFGDALEQPAFFEKFFVLRMPHKRQVRVQDEWKDSRACRDWTLKGRECSKSNPQCALALIRITSPATAGIRLNTQGSFHRHRLLGNGNIRPNTSRVPECWPPTNSAPIKRTSIKAPRSGASMGKIRGCPAAAA